MLLQECAVAQNELLKDFLERIQTRKKEVNFAAVSGRRLLLYFVNCD